MDHRIFRTENLVASSVRKAGNSANGLLAASLFLWMALPASARVLINEIHYDPTNKTEWVEFIELYNTGTKAVNLAGWQISGGVAYVIPENTSIPSGGYTVIAQSPAALQSKYSVAALGPWTGRLSNEGETITLKNASGGAEDQVAYQQGFPWPTIDSTSGFSIQLVNPSFDNDLGGNWRAAAPTPAAQNANFATNLPPQIRQVNHSPNQPVAGQAVTVTAKITDPEGVASATLQYQIVDPGQYIELTDDAYSQNWISIPMNDQGLNGDVQAGDDVYTAVLPASLQLHRRLIRYRITTTDNSGLSRTAPYDDDPQPNFAYFCYNGVPGWNGARQPGTTASLNFSSNVMQRLPVIQLISKNSSVTDCTWNSYYMGSLYLWAGTLVYDGKVYDHIHYRARGGSWRYAMVKNMWKFDFNRGHEFEMRDDYGKKHKTKWTKLNFGACIQQGDYLHRGEQGMFESVAFHLFNLVGVAAPKTTFLQFRVIEDAAEASSTTQYEGDFWGLYLAVESPDGRYLDEHGLPDGNLYKMEDGTGTLNNLSPYGPTDKSDLTAFFHYASYSTPDAWYRTNLNLDWYYAYKTIVEGIHHYDIAQGKNYFYFHNPDTGIWSVHPWDTDLTWANNMYGTGQEPFSTYVLGRANFLLEYKNKIREIRDLLFNTNEAWQVIDEHAQLLRGPTNSPTFLDADRAMWDYNPRMAGGWKAGTGLFYAWPEKGVTKDFSGCIQLMKNYVTNRAAILDKTAPDTGIPTTPVITYSGLTNHPLNRLSFKCSAYAGSKNFAAMNWRIGEVFDTSAPSYDPTEPRPYEITTIWQSGELSTYASGITIPADALKVGHAYRARVRVKDAGGNWSHWSQPAQFIAGESDNAAALLANLRITELMYNPADGGDYEFIELHNLSQTTLLDLGGVTFTSGIDYTFTTNTTLAPQSYLVVIKNASAAAFRTNYSLSANTSLAGPYSGSLANEGEQVTLKTATGGTEIASFKYGHGRGWPIAAAGAGHSLVPVSPDADGQASGALDYPGNWRASTYVKGSPGQADPALPDPTVLLNEFAANTQNTDSTFPDYDSNDWIELYNPTSVDQYLSNWYLSDDPGEPRKWAIPAVTVPSRGWISMDEITGFHNPTTTGFGLSQSGEQILLSHMSGTATDRVVDTVVFSGQPPNLSLGRYPDGAGYWYSMSPSRLQANQPPLNGIRIVEFMYHPADFDTNDNTRDEYVKLFNPSTAPVILQNTNGPWRLAGGIDFSFPSKTTIPARGALLIVSFDPAATATLSAFMTVYGSSNTPILGPYTGKLSNRSDRLSLEKPQAPATLGDPLAWIIEDEVIYGNQTPWPLEANGTGFALRRLSLSQSGNDPANWVSSLPTPLKAMDWDQDGMPDAWELAHGLNPDDPADASQDADGDGMSNALEYFCGTDPNNAQSVLKFDSVQWKGSAISLHFTGQANHAYSIHYTADLLNGPWIKLTDIPAPSQTGDIEITDDKTQNDATRFYRLDTPVTH